jgi:4-amino-4-deoxy-L-arabinose transferase-like glycosyltransferase
MPVVLPVICFLLVVVWLTGRTSNKAEAFIFAACFWGALLYGITESLSLLHLISRSGLVVAWSFSSLGVGLSIWKQRAVQRPSFSNEFAAVYRALEVTDRLLLGAIAFLILLVGLTAVVSPPNSWDAMYYHLPRVVMWISNRSVRFFPTMDFEQLGYGPWSEYAMLHIDLLFGNDRLVNLVPFSALLGSGVAASVIARELGARSHGQVLAAVTCATLPSAVLAGSGPKNDLTVTFWIVAAIYSLIRFNKTGSWLSFSASACASGLALLSKATAAPLLPPMLAACWLMGSSSARRLFLWRLPVFAIIVLLLNGPLWYRNFTLTGSPMPGNFVEGGHRLQQSMQKITIKGIVANIIRNLTLQVQTTEKIDHFTGRVAVRAIKAIGENPDDPDSLWHLSPEVLGYSHFAAASDPRDEVTAGNPIHLVLLLLAITVSFLSTRRVGKGLPLFSLGLIASFVLFCALLRWELSHARYVIPLFALGAALMGAVLPIYFPKPFTTAVAIVLIAAAMPFVLTNELRPLVSVHLAPSLFIKKPLYGSIWIRSRTDLYFADRHEDLRDGYVAAANAVRNSGCNEIGLDNSLELYEYPVLAMLGVEDGTRRVCHMGVYNSTAKYAIPHPPPCAVICFACARVPHKWSEYRDIGGRVSIFDGVAVFSRQGNLLNTEVAAPRPLTQVAATTQAKLDRDIRQLKELRSDGFRSGSALWMQGLAKYPYLMQEFETRFDELRRPFLDGARVCELTLRLRTRNAPLLADSLGTLIDAQQGLESFIDAERRAAEKLDALFVRAGKIAKVN